MTNRHSPAAQRTDVIPRGHDPHRPCYELSSCEHYYRHSWALVDRPSATVTRLRGVTH